MKNRVSIIMVLVSILSFGQQEESTNISNNNGISFKTGPSGGKLIETTGSSSLILNPPRNVEGSVYLYDKWLNLAVIETNGGSFKTGNINFNAKANAFQSQIPNTDSIFTFNFANINQIVVNNKIFRSIYSPIEGREKIYQVVAELEEYVIYKEYYIKIKEGNPNPLLNRLKDKYALKTSYYVKNGNSFRRLNYKKSNILKTFGDKGDVVARYAKENNLSFKDEQQLQRIISYYGTL